MRIRSIKPEFWKSEDISALDWDHRLIFIGLWSYVDDNGVGRDNPKLIVADLFPLEDDPRDTLARVSRALQALHGRDLIIRYLVEDKAYLYITTWAKHQKIDRPAKARYPEPTCGNAVIRDTLSEGSMNPREGVARVPLPDQGNRGTEEQGNEGTKTRPSPREQPPLLVEDVLVTATAATDSVSRKTIDEHFDEFWAAYPRKVGKQDARRVWDRVRKDTPVEDILTGVIRYRDDPNLPEQQFIPHPATWLHRGGWDDDPCAPPPVMRTSRPTSEDNLRETSANLRDFARALTDGTDPGPLMIGDGR